MFVNHQKGPSLAVLALSKWDVVLNSFPVGFPAEIKAFQGLDDSVFYHV